MSWPPGSTAQQPARLIFLHLLPNFTSYLLVNITLAIPGNILGETSLSFLGLGIQPPAVSWGTLLQDAQNLTVVAQRPWQLIPGMFVVLTVLDVQLYRRRPARRRGPVHARLAARSC